MIQKIKISRERVELKSPYRLSFDTLNHIESIFARIQWQEGAITISEAVALPGYSWETPDSIHSWLSNCAEKILSGNCHDPESYALKNLPSNPFAASALLSALNLHQSFWQPPKVMRIPLTASLDLENTSSTISNTQKAVEEGFTHLKIKVGQDITRDLELVQVLTRIMSPHTRIRLDANQGYSYDDAVCLIEALNSINCPIFELLEQPLDWKCWDDMAKLCKIGKMIPLMLDESIYNQDDIKRAKDIGCRAIKLKLFKNGGLNRTLALAEYANSIGLKVVLGNGVATNVGNFMEALIYHAKPKLFWGPIESNGYKKLLSAPFGPNLKTEKNLLVYEHNKP